MTFKIKYNQIINVFLIAFILSISVNGQSTEATLILLDGSEFVGYGKIIKNNKILFRMELEDEPDKWDATQVERIEFDHGFKIVTYEFVQFKKSKPILYRVIEPGFMTLYAFSESYWTPNSTVANGFMGGSYKVSTTNYYIKRTDRDILYPVARNENAWKKRLINCFDDCPELMEIFNSPDIRNYKIEDLVWNFNETCGE